jgi:hypothetical protein
LPRVVCSFAFLTSSLLASPSPFPSFASIQP